MSLRLSWGVFDGQIEESSCICFQTDKSLIGKTLTLELYVVSSEVKSKSCNNYRAD